MNVIRVAAERGERASAMFLVVVMVVVAVVALRIVSEAVIAGDMEARAQAGADAVALAAAAGSSHAEALAVADLNGVRIVAIQQSGNMVTVTVSRGLTEARARAQETVSWNNPAP